MSYGKQKVAQFLLPPHRNLRPSTNESKIHWHGRMVGSIIFFPKKNPVGFGSPHIPCFGVEIDHYMRSNN